MSCVLADKSRHRRVVRSRLGVRGREASTPPPRRAIHCHDGGIVLEAGRGAGDGARMTHFAVKKLTRSDLTFFEVQFRRQNAGNQKSINLNADVFIDDIFPYAPAIAAGDQSRQFLVRLEIFGPGLRRTPDIKARKVIRGDTYKNWRLNGEFVPDPDDDPTRYHNLAAGDLVVFGFDESRAKPVPESIAMVRRHWSE
jgi:hypothetical protein